MTRVQLWRARGILGFLICQIDEETGCYLSDDAHTVLVQTDWDYPSTASTFGWDIRDSQVMNACYYGVPCSHSETDGTVKCLKCGLTPTTFIRDAAEYLDAHLGAIAEDPGYFD
jgi:hypothetical protein